MTASVEAGLARALAFLRRRQDASGEFPVRMWREGEDPSAGVADHTLFTTACVLYALRHAGAGQADDIARAAVRFLIKEMRPPGVWSYWTTDSGKRIDPDLDDTALISVLLRRHHPHIALGTNVEAILSARDEAGLFRTWLRGPDRPNDVDAVVNANVVLYLGERPGTEAARAHLRDLVLTGQEAGRTDTTSTMLPCITRSRARRGTGSGAWTTFATRSSRRPSAGDARTGRSGTRCAPRGPCRR